MCYHKHLEADWKETLKHGLLNCTCCAYQSHVAAAAVCMYSNASGKHCSAHTNVPVKFSSKRLGFGKDMAEKPTGAPSYLLMWIRWSTVELFVGEELGLGCGKAPFIHCDRGLISGS